MTRRHLLPLVLAAAWTLSACTITFVPADGPVVDRPRPAPSASAAIERFESLSSHYRVGDRIAFRVRTNRTGYVTLTARDPDGSVYVLARNVPVRANRTEVVPAPFGRVSFVAAAPVGLHVIRAHFTPEVTPERVVFVGRASLDAWLAQIVLEIGGFGFGADDVAQTTLTIRH